jgi:peptide deformylase
MDIQQLGNLVLRQVAQPVEDVLDPDVQLLIDRLLTTLKDKKGVGIAAPQVGKSIRLLIVASHPNDRYPHAPLMEPTAIVNPAILNYSDRIEKDWEGCLSVPGIRGLVPRHQAIDVEYCDREGKLQRATYTDFVARIFQHEYDHLDGKVFLDRVESSLELISESEYLKLIATK